jgi:8-amino-7-oxononanoate synthase
MDFISIDSGYKPEVYKDGTDYLFFGGTSYLGLNYHPEYLNVFAAGIKKWGLNNGASRNNNIGLSIYQEAEELLAKDYGCEAAVTLSSGWLAAELAVEVLGKKRELIYINDSHPALYKEIPAILNIRKAVDYINLSHQTDFLLISNSVNNILPEVFDFSALSQILPSKNITLLTDHSHGFGFLEDGWTANFRALPTHIDWLLCGSLAKSLSLDAGIILGSNHHINEIKKSATFNGSSPCSPALLYLYLNSKSIRSTAKLKLFENLDYLTSKLNRNDFYWIENFPVILIQNKEIVSKLKANHFLFTAFPYPYPQSKTLNRLVISAAHQQKHLEKLISKILI